MAEDATGRRLKETEESQTATVTMYICLYDIIPPSITSSAGARLQNPVYRQQRNQSTSQGNGRTSVLDDLVEASFNGI